MHFRISRKIKFAQTHKKLVYSAITNLIITEFTSFMHAGILFALFFVALIQKFFSILDIFRGQ